MIRCRGAACVPHCCRVQIGRLLQQAVIFSTTNQQRDKELKILSRLKVLFSNQIKKNRKAHLSFVGVSAQLCQKVVFVFRTRGTGRFNAARARARARGVGQQFQWDDRDEQLGCHRASADDWTMCLCGASMCGLLWSHCDDFEGGYSGCHQEFLLQCWWARANRLTSTVGMCSSIGICSHSLQPHRGGWLAVCLAICMAIWKKHARWASVAHAVATLSFKVAEGPEQVARFQCEGHW